jgi:hypothetical protein
MYRLSGWVETMLKNQQDVAVLKAELEYLDVDFRPQQAVHEVKSFGVRPECANPKCQTEFHWRAEGNSFDSGPRGMPRQTRINRIEMRRPSTTE